ncbi:PAS domain S-box protein [Deinococcus sp. RM]|uniref:PAS domain S-box protein n=1 Tax=Deinococcus sp. RM TaxID=2316359 RepID=UPI000E688ECC|nr:PAS domain S-box protein [Deinococcus sp. RM]RIY15539.1 PAS domain S-box protein [Deinococcus sp. RM]
MTDPTLSQDAAHAVALGILTHFQRQADQGLIVLDERLHVADVTASLDARLDPDAEVRGQPLLELIHPEDQAAVPDDLLVQLHSGQDVHVEVRLNTRGVAVWCELDFLPVTPPQPGMWALAIVRDITPRKAAEQHARILEARRNALMDVAMDAIISIDRHGRVVAWNPAATNMFGYTLKEVLGQQLSALIIRPAERDAHQRGMARHQQTGETRVAGRRVQVTALHKSGHTLPVELMMKPVQIDGQQYYTAFIHDLTDQLEAQRRLREQALHLNMMQEQLPTLSWTTDPDLNVRMVSGQTLQRLRLDPRALVGRHVTALLGGGREEDIVGAHLSALAGQRGRYIQRVQERVFEIHVSPLHDTFDRVVGTVALAHDVTDGHREQLAAGGRAGAGAAVHRGGRAAAGHAAPAGRAAHATAGRDRRAAPDGARRAAAGRGERGPARGPAGALHGRRGPAGPASRLGGGAGRAGRECRHAGTPQRVDAVARGPGGLRPARLLAVPRRGPSGRSAGGGRPVPRAAGRAVRTPGRHGHAGGAADDGRAGAGSPPADHPHHP